MKKPRTKPKFNKTEYQRLYMRDKRLAAKQGVTVSELRKQRKEACSD